MNTAPHGRCQSAGRARRRGQIVAFARPLAGCGWHTRRCAAGRHPGPTPPPAWQRELWMPRSHPANRRGARPRRQRGRRCRPPPASRATLRPLALARYPTRPPCSGRPGNITNRTPGPTSRWPAGNAPWRSTPRTPRRHAHGRVVPTSRGRVRDACGQFQRAVDTRPDVAAYHSDLANVLYLFRRELLDPARPSRRTGRAGRGARALPARGRTRPRKMIKLAQAYAETFYIFADPDWERRASPPGNPCSP